MVNINGLFSKVEEQNNSLIVKALNPLEEQIKLHLAVQSETLAVQKANLEAIDGLSRGVSELRGVVGDLREKSVDRGVSERSVRVRRLLSDWGW